MVTPVGEVSEKGIDGEMGITGVTATGTGIAAGVKIWAWACTGKNKIVWIEKTNVKKNEGNFLNGMVINTNPTYYFYFYGVSPVQSGYLTSPQSSPVSDEIRIIHELLSDRPSIYKRSSSFGNIL